MTYADLKNLSEETRSSRSLVPNLASVASAATSGAALATRSKNSAARCLTVVERGPCALRNALATAGTTGTASAACSPENEARRHSSIPLLRAVLALALSSVSVAALTSSVECALEPHAAARETMAATPASEVTSTASFEYVSRSFFTEPKTKSVLALPLSDALPSAAIDLRVVYFRSFFLQNVLRVSNKTQQSDPYT